MSMPETSRNHRRKEWLFFVILFSLISISLLSVFGSRAWRQAVPLKTSVPVNTAGGVRYLPYKLQFLDDIEGPSSERLFHGNPNKKEIALTFDDGPKPSSTPRLLALLKQYHVRATFFVVGTRVEQFPELARAEASAGHSIGNHTYHHDKLTALGPVDLESEIRACSDAIQSATGKSPRFFRPPGGSFDEQVTSTAQRLGYLTILWTANSGDYLCPKSAVIEARAVASAENGAILLFHDGVPQTLEALPNIITRLHRNGYQFVTIDQMVRQTR